jgi:sugar phosphate isomerase/epimerase
MKDGQRFPLSLHHLNAFDISHAELIDIAGEMGCDHVCLFTYVPEAARQLYPAITAEDVPMLRERLAAADVTLCNLEVFPLDGEEDWAGFETALARGAGLGATRATAHIHGTDDPETATRRFAAFCDRAARHGITAGLEFHAFTSVHDIRSAARIVRQAERENGQLVCDVLHLIRNGGTPADVEAAADIIGYAQISDGPLIRPSSEWWREAIGERAIPGAGEFPLRDILAFLRPGTVVEMEVPQGSARKAGVSARDRIARLVQASRSLLASLPAKEAAE